MVPRRICWWLGALVLLAGGLWGFWREVSAAWGQELRPLRFVVVVDGSCSMLCATGTGETRLDAARRLAQTFVEAYPDAEYALVSFGGEAMLESPPSRDVEAFQTALAEIEPALGFSPGSDMAAGVSLGERLLAEETGCVVLLTDGEVQAPAGARSRLFWRERRGALAWCVLGLGEARPVPLGESWLRDPDTGMVAMSQADEEELEQCLGESSATQVRLAPGMSAGQLREALGSVIRETGGGGARSAGGTPVACWLSAGLGCVLLLCGLWPWGRCWKWRHAWFMLAVCWGMGLAGGQEAEPDVTLSAEERGAWYCRRATALWRLGVERLQAGTPEEALAETRRGLAMCREALRLFPALKAAQQTLGLLLVLEARGQADVEAAEQRRAEALAAANQATGPQAPAERRTEMDDVLSMPGKASSYGGASGEGLPEGVPAAPERKERETTGWKASGEVSGWGRLMRRERRLRAPAPGVKPW